MKLSVAWMLLIAALTFALASCSRASHASPGQPTMSSDVAPGTLLIDILQGGRPEHYFQFDVHPTTGLVRIIKETTFADYAHEDMPRKFQEPAGSIGACEGKPNLVAVSPDGVFFARCRTTNYADRLEIQSAKPGGGNAVTWNPKGRGIRGFAWAANSHAVAILNVSSYYGKNPMELLSGLAGHPVPHDKVMVDIFDVRTGQVTEYTIRVNVISSFTRILNWSDK